MGFYEKRAIFAPVMHFTLKRYTTHYRALVSLGVPIVVGQIGNVILGFADTLMIGHHSMKELAAASFVTTMFTLIVIFAMGFSYGLTPIVGAMFGRGEKEEIGGILRNSLAANGLMAVILLAVSVVFYLNLHRMGQPVELLPYMRSYLLVNIVSLPFLCMFNAFKQFYDGITDTRVPMFVILGGNVLNIFGNYVLIYGAFGMPELGLLGAGISTMVSRIVMFVAFVAVFVFHRSYAPYRRGYAAGRLNRADFRRINTLGWPVAMQLGMECAAFSLSAIFVGWIGITALAAHQVTLTASQLLYMVNSGMAAAIAVRVSYFHGQGDTAAVRDAAYAGFHVIMLIAFVLSVPVFLLRNTFSYWFTDSAEVCVLVSQTVIPLIVYQFGDGLQYTFANALRGISCVRPLIWIAFFSYFVVSLPLGWFLGIHSGWGLVGVWSAFPVCLLCAGILYWLCFIRRLRRP